MKTMEQRDPTLVAYEFFQFVDRESAQRLITALGGVKPHPTLTDIIYVLAVLLSQAIKMTPEDARQQMLDGFDAVFQASMLKNDKWH
jgi:hypothetical protein